MANSELEKLVDFFEKVGELRKIKRAGPLERGVKNPQAVSDHSFRTAVMALMLARKLECDELKLVKLALVHDLHEAVCGDLVLDYSKVDSTPSKLSKKEKRRIELKAIAELTAMLDSKTAKGISKLWLEHETGQSREAKISRQLDKLEMLLEVSEYEREKNWKKLLFGPYLKVNTLKISEGPLKQILGIIVNRTANPKQTTAAKNKTPPPKIKSTAYF